MLSLFVQGEWKILSEFVEMPISRACFLLLLLSDAMSTRVRSSGRVAELNLHPSESSEQSPTLFEIATGLNGDAVGPKSEFELVLLNGLARGTIKHPSVLEQWSEREL